MKNLHLDTPDLEVKKITEFLNSTFKNQNIKNAVIAVSGGIDSALALVFLSKALDVKNIFPVFLPFGGQNMDDAKAMAEFRGIPQENWREINIEGGVQELAKAVGGIITGDEAGSETVGEKSERESEVRLGNIMARVRMIIVYDLAKKKQSLVCGTENKSEHLLGYYTRFGDGASDIEPIVHLYKTQVRQLAEFLKLPENILEKKPSAGLWQGQTDEEEMGFNYEVADRVLWGVEKLIGGNWKLVARLVSGSKGREVDGVSAEIVKKVVERVKEMGFKGEVPYRL